MGTRVDPPRPRGRDPRSPLSTTVDAVSRATSLQEARSQLHNADPVMARLIDARPDFDPRAWLAQLPPMDLYGALLFQIVGQQLSVAATRRTLERIQALFGGHLPSPAELLAIDPGSLRQAGLSWRKIGTLRDLAERLSDGRLDVDVLTRLSDEEFMAALTAISGIGPWTAQGALLIALQRDWRCGRPSKAPTSSTICRANKRSSPSPKNGGLTAAWPPVTCSPRPSTRPAQYPEAALPAKSKILA